MRRGPTLALVGFILASIVACDATDATNLRRSSRRGGGVPSVGSAQQHDDGDDDGADDADPGNPNASALPSAPTSAGQSTGQFAMALASNTPAVDLGDKVDIDVTLEPKAGFKGDVDLSVAGLPPGVTATFVPPKITLNTTAAKSKLTLSAPATTAPSAPNTSAPLVITGKSGGAQATSNANFKVNPRVKLTIPVNVQALTQAGGGTAYRDEWGAAFGANPQPLKTQQGNGIVFVVFNADSKAHIVHGANGFAHGDTQNPIQPNAFETQGGAVRQRTLQAGTNANGYPHDLGNAGPAASFRIRIEAQ